MTETLIPTGIQRGCMTRKNIKVSEDTFETLESDKPDGVSWDRYLTDMQGFVSGLSRAYGFNEKEDFSGWRENAVEQPDE